MSSGQYFLITPTTTPWTCTCDGIEEDRLHRRVGGLQANAAVVAVELLQRDVRAADERDHHLAVVGRLAILDDDEVAVADLLVDHRVALDAQHVGFALADEVLGHGDGLARWRPLRWARRPRRSRAAAARSRDARARREQLDRAAAVPGAADEALLLEVGQVLVHRGQRRQAEAPADLLEARRVAVLLDEFLQVVENFALALRQWLHLEFIRGASPPRTPLRAHSRGPHDPRSVRAAHSLLARSVCSLSGASPRRPADPPKLRAVRELSEGGPFASSLRCGTIRKEKAKIKRSGAEADAEQDDAAVKLKAAHSGLHMRRPESRYWKYHPPAMNPTMTKTAASVAIDD